MVRRSLNNHFPQSLLIEKVFISHDDLKVIHARYIPGLNKDQKSKNRDIETCWKISKIL